MTLSEFKAWFSGYTESIENRPTEKQWARIKARVDEIDNMPTTRTVYVDRYWGPYYRPYSYLDGGYSIYSAGTSNAVGMAANNAVMSMASDTTPRSANAAPTINTVWDSGVAMTALGKADAQADAA